MPFVYVLVGRFPGSVSAVVERYAAHMNYVSMKGKNTPTDVIFSLLLCECQPRNNANVLH